MMFFIAVRHLYVGESDDADSAVRTSSCLSTLFRQDDSDRRRSARSSAALRRLPHQDPQAKTVAAVIVFRHASSDPWSDPPRRRRRRWRYRAVAEALSHRRLEADAAVAHLSGSGQRRR